MDSKHKLDLDKMGVDSVLAREVIIGKDGKAFLGSKSVSYSIVSMDVKSNAIFDMK